MNPAKNLPDTVSGYPGAMVYVDFTARGIQRKLLQSAEPGREAAFSEGSCGIS